MQSILPALTALAVITLPAQAQSAPQTEAAQALFDEFAAAYPALNAVVMQNDEIVFSAEGGTQTLPSDGTGQRYNIYSTAKPLTGMAYARLVERDGFDLDQSVRAIDPALPAHYQDVTPRQLLSHTAGVRGYTGQADWLSFNDLRCERPSDALPHFITDPLTSTPGETYAYTTYGFVVLSHLLVTLTETDSFDDAMHAVLGPLYTAEADASDADKAMPLFDAGQGPAPMPLTAECKFGGGGLIASAEELAGMGAAFAAGEVVSIPQIETMLAPIEAADGSELNYVYGMGAGYDPSADLHYAAHSGGSPGGRSFLLIYVEPQIVVATTASFDGPNHQALAIGLADIFAGAQ